jgi:hypothetical protein
MKKLYIIFFFIVAVIQPGSAVSETIDIYTYHNHPPFVTGQARGLSYDLLNMLNEKAGDSYNFALHIIPRARINMITHDWHGGNCPDPDKNCKDNWMIIWVNPQWGFGKDPFKTCNYIPIISDSNSIISLIKHKVEYSEPKSLIGLKFGGMLGHKYVGIDDLVQKGLITRIDGIKERDNVFKLIKKRVDVILLPTSTIQYFISKDKIVSMHASELYIAPTTHQEYRRNFMVPKTRVDITKFLESVDLSSDSWKTQLRNSGLINGD